MRRRLACLFWLGGLLAAGAAAAEALQSGTVGRLPPGFAKIMEGFRSLRGKREPVAHLVFSDGLVAVSVLYEGVEYVQSLTYDTEGRLSSVSAWETQP